MLPAYGTGTVHKLFDSLDSHDAADIDEADGIPLGQGRKRMLLKVHTGAGEHIPVITHHMVTDKIVPVAGVLEKYLIGISHRTAVEHAH